MQQLCFWLISFGQLDEQDPETVHEAMTYTMMDGQGRHASEKIDADVVQAHALDWAVSWMNRTRSPTVCLHCSHFAV